MKKISLFICLFGLFTLGGVINDSVQAHALSENNSEKLVITKGSDAAFAQ